MKCSCCKQFLTVCQFSNSERKAHHRTCRKCVSHVNYESERRMTCFTCNKYLRKACFTKCEWSHRDTFGSCCRTCGSVPLDAKLDRYIQNNGKIYWHWYSRDWQINMQCAKIQQRKHHHVHCNHKYKTNGELKRHTWAVHEIYTATYVESDVKAKQIYFHFLAQVVCRYARWRILDTKSFRNFAANSTHVMVTAANTV